MPRFRCVGVGECRRHEGGVMCPSYMVTREESHSTRGRARLLFELLNGDELEGGWRNEEVAEALDLCLACKGCKGDCPVNVDMATYKAEFRAHHYAGRLRPRAAYSMGLIHWWAKLAAHAPRLVNALAGAPLLSSRRQAHRRDRRRSGRSRGSPTRPSARGGRATAGDGPASRLRPRRTPPRRTPPRRTAPRVPTAA